MRFFTSFLLAALCLTAVLADIKSEEGVLVITEDNFEDALKAYPYILFEFYAPWCGHCKSLAPEYAKAAQELEKSSPEIKLAKVDATVHAKLAEKHDVQGYPTLKFYRNGKVIDYSGGRTADSIVNWLKKKIGPVAKDLSNVDEAKELIESSNVVVLGFFKDQESEAAKVFLEVANGDDDHVFGITSNEELFKEHGVEDGKVVLFKKFDDGKAEFEGELDIKGLQNFISLQSLPLIIEFNQENAPKIFTGEIKSHLLVFFSEKAGHLEKHLEDLKEPAKTFREKVLFVTINADENDHERILDFFGLKKDDLPSMRIIKMEQQMSKYKPEKEDLSKENVVEFVSAFVEGKLKKHLLTEDIPEDWDKNPVKVLVGHNFHEVAFNKEKDVLVEFYAPWCGHCQELAPIYEELGEKYKDSETVIAKMDATANEVEDIKITNFPTIMLFKKETNKGIEYNGERTLAGLSEFIESGGAYGQGPTETQEVNEDDDVPRKDEL